MEPVALFLLAAAGILLVGALGEALARRTGVPDALLLMLGGALLGPVLGLTAPWRMESLLPEFASLALAVVAFESGSRLRLGDLAGSRPGALALGLGGTAASAAAVAAASMLAASLRAMPPGWGWKDGLLLGAVLAGPSAALAAPALARARAEAPAVATLARESAVGESLALTAAAVLAAGASGGALGIGLGIGAVAGLVWLLFLKSLRTSNHAYSVTLGVTLLLMVGTARAGGVPVAAALAAAAVLGNAPAIARALKLSDVLELGEDVRGFHSQLAFLIKALFFVYLGTRLGPPLGPVLLGAAFGAAAYLARRAVVPAALGRAPLSDGSRRMLAACGPRGLVSGVAGAMAYTVWSAGDPATAGIVSGAVAASLILFAALFPLARGASPAVRPAAAWSRPAPAEPARVAPEAAAAPAGPFAGGPGVSAPVAPEEIVPLSGIEPDVRPGSGFRW